MVWNKSFTVSICVYIREAFWLLLWFGPTVPKTPYSTGYRHKVNSWPRQGHLAHNFTNSCHCKNMCHPKIYSKVFWKKKYETHEIFSPGLLSWQQALKPHVLTALEGAQLHGQGWGVRSSIPPSSSCWPPFYLVKSNSTIN